MPTLRTARPLLIALVLPFAGIRAQEQERKLIDRIMKPDMELRSSLADREFHGADGFRTRTFSTREFPGSKTAPTCSFETGRPRDADRAATFGKYTYRIPDASSFRKPAREASKTVETRTVPVSTAREAGRASPVHESPDADRPFLVRGKSQDIFDQRQGKTRKPISIDELRDLLNKSK